MKTESVSAYPGMLLKVRDSLNTYQLSETKFWGLESYKEHSVKDKKSLWKIECFLEDLFLGGQLSIILGYRRLSVV